MSVFGPTFDPTGHTGPRGKQHPDRRDAFQQLVGDGLKEQLGVRVSVATTKGQDGSIDAFIEAAADSQAEYLDLPLPIIVECKDHEQLPTVANNVLATWRKLREKLASQAEEEWPDNFAPWRRTRGYLYCVSALLASTAVKDELKRQIEDFFNGLPPGQKPSIERVRVMDWSDIRAWLDPMQRVADRWLGVGLERILSHSEHIARLSGFRKFLLDENLSYVLPPPEDLAHPDHILETVTNRAGSGGLIMVGAGGVGKTRTSLEVAARAERAGWRVLHVLPGEPGVTVDELAVAVLQEEVDTLVVFDYLDQMHRLDMAALRHRLLPSAVARGMRLALLANARPSGLRVRNEERDALFSRVIVNPTDLQRRQISTAVQQQIAPQALSILGPDRVSKLCGERPIIAMFIAIELERRAKAGTLDEPALKGLRPQDLTGWLRKRLAEDRLLPKDSGGLLPEAPEPAVMAAATALAVAPLYRDAMLNAVQRTLALVDPAGVIAAVTIVDLLLSLGWIEQRQGLLAAAHDVVADEVLEQALWQQPDDSIRVPMLNAVLAAALSTPRVFGRLALTLSRLLGPTPASEHFKAGLQAAAHNWLAENSSALGITLAAGDPDEASFALGAALSDPPWSETCIDHWQELIAPWLARHGILLEARHLLYRGLKHVPSGSAGTLSDTALAWLITRGAAIEAGFVLAPLLARTDLKEDQASAAVTRAIAWLQSEHGKAIEAEFVFHSLLARTDLTETQASSAIAEAFAWLQSEYGNAIEARFVLHPLLARKDLTADQASAAIAGAVAWLKSEYGKAIEASFVLAPLLARTDLTEVQASAAIAGAVAWVQSEHGNAIEAGFVLPPLLARTDLTEVQASAAIARAIAWLQSEHGNAIKAQFVIHSLLDRTELTEVQASAAIARAVAWVQSEHGNAIDAQFVFHSLLARTELTEVQASAAIARAVAWVQSEHGNAIEAGFVLPPLLARTDLTEVHASAAIARAVAWLEIYPSTADAEFVLKRLLGHPALPAHMRARCAGIALRRLKILIDKPEASFLLRSCLQDKNFPPELDRRRLDLAFAWMEANRRHSDMTYVFNPILRRSDILDGDWKRAAHHALAWLKHTRPGKNRSFALSPVLTRLDLLQATDRDWLISDAMSWLQTYCRSKKTAGYLIGNLSRHVTEVDALSKLEALRKMHAQGAFPDP